VSGATADAEQLSPQTYEKGGSMIELPTLIPGVEMLLSLTPEELGVKLLFLLQNRGGEMLHLGNMQLELWQRYHNGQPQYSRQCEKPISVALTEAWAWLQTQGLLIAEDGTNGQNGFVRLSRRGRNMKTEADFTSFKTARLFPKEILHRKIAERVWLAFMRGEFDVAAFRQ
jgi:hypothetical protein